MYACGVALGRRCVSRMFHLLLLLAIASYSICARLLWPFLMVYLDEEARSIAAYISRESKYTVRVYLWFDNCVNYLFTVRNSFSLIT